MPSCDDDSSIALSCPDLRAESEASGDSDIERSESPANAFDPSFNPSFDPVGGYRSPSVLDECQSSRRRPEQTTDVAARRKLQHNFWGLAIWLELEEFDNDLTRAVEDFSSRHASPLIPKPHTTAIYGMKHLSADEARERLGMVRKRIDQWPTFARPTGVQSDVAQCGRPGQVCSIAWSELTLATDDRHESALDELYDIFFGPDGRGARERPWKPHNSIAYDNPETNSLSLLDTVMTVMSHDHGCT
ncbi:hypothetical protein THAOC_09349 [Thalassiosira oceanica]|uniref:Uncharacterized protein n=1 Tax=Thalassiosira oceanica TaxID=159749 RepID=K0T7T1_THAOC|nr:hypothetical protein THAOC_09349 [Thalassiosira oceanica]|eukprot:EJK69401.1 hypothetical protein THAOC_09349 [Thalassiosira oceanica]